MSQIILPLFPKLLQNGMALYLFTVLMKVCCKYQKAQKLSSVSKKQTYMVGILRRWATGHLLKRRQRSRSSLLLGKSLHTLLHKTEEIHQGKDNGLPSYSILSFTCHRMAVSLCGSVNDMFLESLHKGIHACKEVLMMELNKKYPLKQISLGG